MPQKLRGIAGLASFVSLFVVACALALVTPGLERRRRLIRRMTQYGLAVLGLRASITGLDRLPEDSCVVVANHASYLDGLVMKALLPPRFSFVIKREVAGLPVVGWLLRRIDAEFLERQHHARRQKDARRVMRRAELGHSLVFFPEGTFTGERGLRRFHSGAFATAARAGCPVVPAVIVGTRRALPDGEWLPLPGPVLVEVLEPLPSSAPEATSDWLRDESRRRILAKLDEPDLVAAPRT